MWKCRVVYKQNSYILYKHQSFGSRKSNTFDTRVPSNPNSKYYFWPLEVPFTQRFRVLLLVPTFHLNVFSGINRICTNFSIKSLFSVSFMCCLFHIIEKQFGIKMLKVPLSRRYEFFSLEWWLHCGHQSPTFLSGTSNHFHFSSVTQSCLTLCNPMSRSTPGLPVHHQLPQSTQTHVHWVGDAIQLSHPLSSPSPPVLNLSQNLGLSQWDSSSHQVTKVLEFQLQHQSFQWTPKTDLL